MAPEVAVFFFTNLFAMQEIQSHCTFMFIEIKIDQVWQDFCQLQNYRQIRVGYWSTIVSHLRHAELVAVIKRGEIQGHLNVTFEVYAIHFLPTLLIE